VCQPHWHGMGYPPLPPLGGGGGIPLGYPIVPTPRAGCQEFFQTFFSFFSTFFLDSRPIVKPKSRKKSEKKIRKSLDGFGSFV
jgi:hypothetical protein